MKETVMKSYAVNSVSKSANGKRAQVTVPFGTGSNRQSVTRHVLFVGGKWFGFNPDLRAVPLNERYEVELQKAKSKLAGAEAALEGLKKKLEDAKKTESETGLDEIMVTVATTMLEGMIETAELDVIDTKAIVDDAEAKLDIVRREVPLEVEFFGPGLTY